MHVPTPTTHEVVAATVVLRQLASLVARTRLENQLSYEQAASATGVNVQVIWKLEHNQGGVRVDTAIRLLAWIADLRGGD